jgi:hypothetical protein
MSVLQKGGLGFFSSFFFFFLNLQSPRFCKYGSRICRKNATHEKNLESKNLESVNLANTAVVFAKILRVRVVRKIRVRKFGKYGSRIC